MERPGLTLLDLAGANQSTVAFITDLGEKQSDLGGMYVIADPLCGAGM